MKKTVVGMMALVLLSKIFGFGREMAIGYVYGATVATDIYRAAMTVPNVLVGGMMSAINTALIPYLNKAGKEGKENEFFQKAMTLIALASLLLVVLLIIFARPVSYLVAMKFTAVVRDQAVFYMRFLSVIMMLQILVYSLTGYLQKNGRFYIAASCSIPMNIAIISGIMIFPGAKLAHLVIATIAGFVLQLLWVLYPFIKGQFPFSFRFDLKDEHIRGFLWMMIPIALSQASTQINGIVDQSLASGLAEGSMSMLYYATKLQGVFFSILVVSYSSVLFPKQASLALQEDKRDLYMVTRENLSAILMLVIPLTAGMIFLAQPITRLVYYRGEFTLANATTTGYLLRLYASQTVTASISVILGNLFFSLHKPRIPMIATYVGVGANIILDFILVNYFGVYGLAGASAFASFLSAFVLMVYLKGIFMTKKISVFTPSAVKYVLASLVMLSALKVFQVVLPFDNFSDFRVLVISGVVGIGVYFLSLMALRTSELKEVRKLAGRILGKLRIKK